MSYKSDLLVHNYFLSRQNSVFSRKVNSVLFLSFEKSSVYVVKFECFLLGRLQCAVNIIINAGTDERSVRPAVSSLINNAGTDWRRVGPGVPGRRHPHRIHQEEIHTRHTPARPRALVRYVFEGKFWLFWGLYVQAVRSGVPRGEGQGGGGHGPRAQALEGAPGQLVGASFKKKISLGLGQ